MTGVYQPTVPMWNRASDVKTFALNGGCDLDWLLNHLYAPEAPDQVWWNKGTSIHYGIEMAILNDLDLDQALAEAHLEKEIQLHAARKVGTQESRSNRSKRGGLASLDDDIDFCVSAWFDQVHPDSPNRMHWYEDYAWPPRTEHMIQLPAEWGAALYTEVDAIFEGGPEERPIAIVDWKTGNTKSAPDSQLQIYRYGLHLEGGWFPEGTGPEVGWFHHLMHGKVQHVGPYLGDGVIRQWLLAAAAAKSFMVEEGNVVASPDWYCNYCNVRDFCPVMSDDPEQAKSWVEIFGRLERAERLPIPTLDSD